MNLLNFFYSKTVFWPSYCQISTDLDKILHTPIVVYGIHLWADLDGNRRMGGSRPNQNDYVFCNTCNAPKSSIETRIAAISAVNRQNAEVRTGAIMKNSGIL